VTTGRLVALLFGLGWIPLLFYRTETLQGAQLYHSTWERTWVTVTPYVIAAHMTLGCMLVGRANPPLWRATLGLSSFAAAIGFWFWARAQIGPLRVICLPDQPPRALRRDGPFGVVRNPLYLSYLVAGMAPVIVAVRPVLLFSFAACVAVLVVRAAQEEARLQHQLGAEYTAYCREVKRLIPFVW
jgi:protein-S-isoprenylcysteine O-methyltransferase Ste14